MATHKITLTNVGVGISSTLDLYRLDGVIWVSHTTDIPKASLIAGYEFEDNTGAVNFKLVDNGACGTETIFYGLGEPTTTAAPTTTPAPTTTAAPTTTGTPTTTGAISFRWEVTNIGGDCGHPAPNFLWSAPDELTPCDITFFYVDEFLSNLYIPIVTDTLGIAVGSVNATWTVTVNQITGAVSGCFDCTPTTTVAPTTTEAPTTTA